MQNENRSSLYWQSEYLYLEQGFSEQIKEREREEGRDNETFMM